MTRYEMRCSRGYARDRRREFAERLRARHEREDAQETSHAGGGRAGHRGRHGRRSGIPVRRGAGACQGRGGTHYMRPTRDPVTVRVYSIAAGAHVYSFGRRGEGPGEFRISRLCGLAFDPDGQALGESVWVSFEIFRVGASKVGSTSSRSLFTTQPLPWRFSETRCSPGPTGITVSAPGAEPSSVRRTSMFR